LHSVRQLGLRALAGLSAAALLACATLVASAPARGDDNTSKKLWQLQFEPTGIPKRVVLGKEPNIEPYWYLPFTLENTDAQDHSFFLEITAVTDKGPNFVHYRSLGHPLVKELVRRRLGVRPDEPFWSAEDYTTAHEPTDVSAAFPRQLDMPVIKAGQKVKCVAIFNSLDAEADFITISVRGLTNDVIMKKTAPHERKLSERVFQMHYYRPGDEYYRTEDPIEYTGHEWVIVDRTIKTDLE
jgi:hypothetical protein